MLREDVEIERLEYLAPGVIICSRLLNEQDMCDLGEMNQSLRTFGKSSG